MEEVHEHHDDHVHNHEGSSIASILAVLVVVALIALLLWNFLPIRGKNSTLDVNVNTPSVNGGAETQ